MENITDHPACKMLAVESKHFTNSNPCCGEDAKFSNVSGVVLMNCFFLPIILALFFSYDLLHPNLLSNPFINSLTLEKVNWENRPFAECKRANQSAAIASSDRGLCCTETQAIFSDFHHFRAGSVDFGLVVVKCCV